MIKSLEKNLESSNETINISSKAIINSLKDKTQDPATKEKADIWFPRAQQISKLSLDAFNYIEELKKIKEFESKSIKELFIKLKNYNKDVLNIDSMIFQEFSNYRSIIQYPSDRATNPEKEFEKDFLKNSTPTYTSAMLTKFQNSIKDIENKLLLFCHDHITRHHALIDYFPAPLINQSTKYINPGGIIEISAGIGTFIKLENQKISIGGNIVPINENLTATKQIKANTTPGKYLVPLKLSFINPVTNKEETYKSNVEYTVISPCN